MAASAPRLSRTRAARELLDGFLEDTGVVGSAPPRRYLWTDAFAVCTLLELHRKGAAPDLPGDRDYRDLALALVDQVHHVLGRHREDDPREGWLSGLEGDEAEAHPTAGGLRIGKSLPERGSDDPFHREMEWERDGQYFHYLTRWMHALMQVASAEEDDTYLRWAVELARAAHRGFVRKEAQGDARDMAWKMSVDLSRPLVDVPGQHDALDGYITFRTLAASPLCREDDGASPLAEEISEMAGMAGIGRGTGWPTEDPLGLGGLLADAWRVAQLHRRGEGGLETLLGTLLDSTAAGLQGLSRGRLLDHPPGLRLPFRELGLSTGIHALERLRTAMEQDDFPTVPDGLDRRVHTLAEISPLADRIEGTWLEPRNRALESWTDHADINAVMLATSLVPGGYLDI